MPDLAEVQADDIGADVRAAFDSLSVPDAAPANAEPPPAAVVETTQAATSDGVARDEKGRFAPKTDDAPPPPTLKVAKQPETVQPIPQQSQAAPPEPQSAETILPPQSLSAPIKAKFSQLPPDVQQELVRVAEAVQTAKTEWDGKAQQYNELDRALAPVKQRLALSGLNAGGYVQALVTADEALRSQDSVGALLQVAQLYGISPQAIAAKLGAPGYQAPSQPSDPVVHGLQQQVAQLSQQLTGITSQQEENAMNEARGEIARMRSDPRFLYFDNVSDHMAKLMEARVAGSLEDAYEQATWANPQIRSLLQQQGQVQPTQQTRPSGVQVNGAAALGSVPMDHQDAPLDETPLQSAQRAFKELAGRV